MKCADARHLIHLQAGDDLTSAEDHELSEHLHGCSDCRAYSAGAADVMERLAEYRYASNERLEATSRRDSVSGSVLQALRNRPSPRMESLPKEQRFRGGIVALCVCSLLLAVVSLTNLRDTGVESPVAGTSPMAMPVGYSPTNSSSGSLVAPPTAGHLLHVVTPDGRVIRFFEPSNAPVNSVPQNWQPQIPDFPSESF